MDFLLHRYSNIEFVLKLPWRRSVGLLLAAVQADNKETAFRQYLALLPHMGKDAKPFDQYYKEQQLEIARIDTRPLDEIMADIKRIEERAVKHGTV